MMVMSKARWWVLLVGLSVALVWLDYLTPPPIQFPAAFVVVVLLATWYLGDVQAIAFAVLLPLIRLWMEVALWNDPTITPFISRVNLGIRLMTLVVVIVLTSQIKTLRNALEQRVQVLEGLLPICSFCKKIRSKDGKWEPLESYISDRSGATFSHGVCESCAKMNYPDLA